MKPSKRARRRARGRRIEQRQRDRSFFDWAMDRIRQHSKAVDRARHQDCLTFAEARRRYRLVVMEDEAAAMDWGLSRIAPTVTDCEPARLRPLDP